MRLSHLIVGLAALSIATVLSVQAEEAVNTPAYIVTYFEVAPPVAGQSAAIVL
jgi:hypothetical protein